MDGVIADTTTHFIYWYEKEFGVRVEKEAFHGVPESEALPDNAVRKFVYAPNFFRTLPVMPGAQEAVKKLMEDFEVYIVSAAMEFPQSLFEKRAWLEEHFPFVSWRNIIFCGDKSVIATDYMIDDHVKNLDVCKGKTFMFAAGHNVHIEHHRRVHDWQEVLELMEAELSANP